MAWSQFQNTELEPRKITYIPINSNILTTCHTFQGLTVDTLFDNSWTFAVHYWAHIVLSRVITLNSLVLNERLDEGYTYDANIGLTRWETGTEDQGENIKR